MDDSGRRVLYGYGSSVLPISAGYEEIEIGTWRPADRSFKECFDRLTLKSALA